MAKVPDIHVKVVIDEVVVKAKRLSVASATRVYLGRHNLVQAVGALAVLYGISWWSIPAALCVGGVGAIVAIELNPPAKVGPDDAFIKAVVDAQIAQGKDPFTNPAVPKTPKWADYVSRTRKR